MLRVVSFRLLSVLFSFSWSSSWFGGVFRVLLRNSGKACEGFLGAPEASGDAVERRDDSQRFVGSQRQRQARSAHCLTLFVSPEPFCAPQGMPPFQECFRLRMRLRPRAHELPSLRLLSRCYGATPLSLFVAT